MLTDEQRAKRFGKMTATLGPKLMLGEGQKLLAEWQRIVGDPAYQEEDMSQNWDVIRGEALEQPALDYWERKSGHHLTHRGVWMNHPENDHLGCTLDAYRPDDRWVVDVKCPGRWRKLEDVLSYYPAQLVIQKACMKAAGASLLVVHGGDEPQEHEITWDEDYEAELWSRVAWFWRCVESLQPPVAILPAKPPVPADKTYDFTGSNLWSAHAHAWLQSKQAAGFFRDAATGLKELVPDDAKVAWGHGVWVSRSKAGALSVKEGSPK